MAQVLAQVLPEVLAEARPETPGGAGLGARAEVAGAGVMGPPAPPESGGGMACGVEFDRMAWFGLKRKQSLCQSWA